MSLSLNKVLRNRALLFPPATARGRFLLHRTIEEYFPFLFSFSVGEEPYRRTAITWSLLVARRQEEREQKVRDTRREKPSAEEISRNEVESCWGEERTAEDKVSVRKPGIRKSTECHSEEDGQSNEGSSSKRVPSRFDERPKHEKNDEASLNSWSSRASGEESREITDLDRSFQSTKLSNSFDIEEESVFGERHFHGFEEESVIQDDVSWDTCDKKYPLDNKKKTPNRKCSEESISNENELPKRFGHRRARKLCKEEKRFVFSELDNQNELVEGGNRKTKVKNSFETHQCVHCTNSLKHSHRKQERFSQNKKLEACEHKQLSKNKHNSKSLCTECGNNRKVYENGTDSSKYQCGNCVKSVKCKGELGSKNPCTFSTGSAGKPCDKNSREIESENCSSVPTNDLFEAESLSISQTVRAAGVNFEGSNRFAFSWEEESVEDFTAIDNYFEENSPNTMPAGIMVAEMDSSFNRRRVREPTQIYRPPPARCSKTNDMSKAYENTFYKEEVIQQQQQYLEALKEYQHNLHHSTVTSHHSPNHYSPSPVQHIGNKENESRQKHRRPDQQFYVPRGRRHPDDPTPCSTPTPYDDHPRAPSPANSICSVVSEFSGRNRYSRNGKHNRLSYHEEENRVYGKPPLSFSRESTPASERGKNKASLFAAETLQLIERCINQDPNRPLSGSPGWENSSSNKHAGGMRNVQKDFIKNPNPSRDNHPVHSKENLMHPVGPNNRSRKGRRNRKRSSKSRDHSVESGGSCGRRGSVSSENLERTFYNSNASVFERHGFNYDRMNSRNSSCASSRNPSVERTLCDTSGCEWRIKGYSNPTTPVKHSPPAADRAQRRHSLGKPPSGKIGTAYNVHLDTSTTPVSQCGKASSRLSNVNAEFEEPKTQAVTGVNLTEEKSLPHPVNVKEDVHVQSKEEDIKRNEMAINSSHEEEKYFTTNESQSCAENADLSNSLRIDSPALIDKESSLLESPMNLEEKEGDSVLLSQSSKAFCNDSSCPVTLVSEEAVIDSINHETGTEKSEKEVVSVSEKSDLSEDKVESTTPTKTLVSDTKTEESNPKKFSFNWADEVDQVNEEDSWDSLYDDSGNCLHSSIKEQLEDTIGNIKLEKPANDYYEFKPKDPHIADEEEYSHIIEIYDFPPTFQTQDLMAVFQEFKGFDLKWVNDTHALGIFNTALLAADCLSLVHPFVKTRPLSKAIDASKSKALHLSERLPFKPRPETSVALARRLVSGALGLKVQVSKEQRDAERQKLKNAKEKKKLIAKQKEDAWEGTICNNI